MNMTGHSNQFPKRTKLGREDPRVIRCFTRGNEFYLKDHAHINRNSRDTESSSSERSMVVDDIRVELEKVVKRYPADSNNVFIPREDLDRILTLCNVLSIINTLSCCSHLSQCDRRALAERICFGKTSHCHEPCQKILAVLLSTGCEENLIKLMDDKIDDSCLPFRFSDDGRTLRCRIQNHEHGSVNEGRLDTRISLSAWTYAVVAPYFNRPPGRHVHYILDHDDVLPIVELETQAPTQPRSIQRSQGTTRAVSGGNSRYGGFSHVQRVKIHPSHVNFGSDLPPHSEQVFALKILDSATAEDFDRELASLLSFQDGSDKHLIKLLATFEVTSKKGTTFCLLFPWAEGNLWHFWETCQELAQKTSLCGWMADQCHKLALALMEVHNERRRHLPNFDEIAQSEYELYGRHGDVKADNVLWYRRENSLVISDFGLGRLHSKLTRSGLDPKALPRTESYRAPEFDTKGGISRASDIFSLGCMFLEFVTWHLEGWKSVNDDFPDYRLEPEGGNHNFVSDTFFQIEEGPKGQKTPVIKGKITEWIQKLKESLHCIQYHVDFLELIETRMLHPDSQKRIKSPALVDKLDTFVRTGTMDSSYYKERENPR